MAYLGSLQPVSRRGGAVHPDDVAPDKRPPLAPNGPARAQVVHVETGETIDVWPIDAKELVRTGAYRTAGTQGEDTKRPGR